MLKKEDTIVYREDGIRAPTLNTGGLVCTVLDDQKENIYNLG
jgi:hypothetical protein